MRYCIIIEKSLIFTSDTTATLKNPVSLGFLVNTDHRRASLGCDINNNGSHSLGPLLHSNNGAWKYKHRKPKRSQSWSPYYPNSTACRQILLLGGDISCNPGPVTTQVPKMKTKSQQKRTTNKCPKCEKSVQRNHKRLKCEKCFDLVHIRCADVNSWFVKNTIAKEPRSWICPNCTLAQLPFYSAVDTSSLTKDLTERTGLTEDHQIEKRSHLRLLATRLPTNKSHLKAAHINVNGLLTKAKLQEVQILLETTKFDLLGITKFDLLGPRLFSIYVNDFSESISKGELHLYADDTTAFVIGNSTDEVVVELNLLFEEIHTWCQLNKLTLHTGKTEVMILQKNAFVGPLPPIKCGGNLIEYSNKTKVLGVLLDHRLSWREHVNDVIKSLSRQLCVLKSMRYLSSQLLEEMYFKTIIPQITYCIGVWGSCSGSMFAEIERLHVKAGRIIHKIPRNVSDFDVLDSIKWQDLGYLYKRRLAIEVFKVKEGLNNGLSFFVNFSKSTRKGPLLEIKRVESETGRNSFLFRAPIVWNSLDSRSRFSEELDVFKAELKRNKNQLKKVSFSRGTITNSNKDLGNFIYF